MTLSIEYVALVINTTIERLNRKVRLVCVLNRCLDSLTLHFLLFVIVDKMELLFLNPMVCCDHGSTVWQEANRDQRLIKSRDRLRFIVETENLGNIEVVKYLSFIINKHD